MPELLPLATLRHMPKGCSTLSPFRLAVIAICSLLFLGLCVESYFKRGRDVDGCHMTYMYPDYVVQDKFIPSDASLNKYKLYLYKERNGRHDGNLPEGVPILFIPGNAGSYKQARSLGHEISAQYWQMAENRGFKYHHREIPPPFDVFTMDTNEELAAFQGHLIEDQARYANEAIRYILSLYQRSSKREPPKSVILVAHSMGGIVSRMIFTLPTYVKGLVDTIITLATPHSKPPAPLDSSIADVYRRVNRFWRDFASDLVQNVTLVSIAGGNHDSMISSETTEAGQFLPSSNGFTVYSTGIPGVWTSADHRAILWCNQIVRKLAIGIIDVTWNVPSHTLEDRIGSLRNTFQSKLVHGQTAVEIGSSCSTFTPDVFQRAPKFAKNLTFPESGYNFLAIPTDSMPHTLTYVTDLALEDVFFCKSKSTNGPEWECCTRKSYAIELPSSRTTIVAFEQIPLQELKRLNVEAVAVKTYSTTKTFVAHIESEQQRDEQRLTFNLWTIELALGKTIDVSIKSPMAILSIPSIQNSLLIYKVSWLPLSCTKASQIPHIIHQWAPPSSEEKFLSRAEGDYISFYGDPQLLHNANPSGLQLRIISDGACDLRMRFAIGWRASLGRVIGRYMMAWVCLLVVVCVQIIGSSWVVGSTTGSFPSLYEIPAQLPLRRTLFILVAAGVLQTVLLRLPFPTRVTSHVASLLLGNRDLWFSLLLPGLYIAALGLFVAISAFLDTILWIIGAVFIWIPTSSFGLNRGKPIAFILSAALALKVPHPIFYVLTFIIDLVICGLDRRHIINLPMPSSHPHTPSPPTRQVFFNEKQKFASLLLLLWALPFTIPGSVVWAKDLIAGTSWTGGVQPLASLLVVTFWLLGGLPEIPISWRNPTLWAINVIAFVLVLYGTKDTYICFYAIGFFLVLSLCIRAARFVGACGNSQSADSPKKSR
ncbi:PGAP1-like protein-domain-containing protein [Phlyctochytrium arcticum]|nr:PGAP1-like protein-domain-containing protein [Phlyctochytrium arcticum]